MTDRRRHGADGFHLAGMKNTMTSVVTSSHNIPRDTTDLQQQFTREDVPTKATQYTLLQLITMVRDNPILYDDELQAQIPDNLLKAQKRETWDRIRNDIVWQDVSLVQEVWSDLLDQYARKSMDMSDNLIEAMRWTDSILNKKKSDSRPSSQLNSMSSTLDKNFYADVPLAEDVLEPEQPIGNTSPSLKYDYVVIQPQVNHGRTSSHQTHQPIQNSASQYSRRKSPSPRETEAIVRTYPLSPKRTNHRMESSQEPKIPPIHADIKKDIPSMNFGRQSVLVEVEPSSSSYSTPNSKMYKMVNTQRGSTPQATVTVTSTRRLVQLPHRTSNLGFESMPDQLIEPPNMHAEPPKKKMMMDVGNHHQHHHHIHHRNNTMVGPSSSTMPTTRSDDALRNTKVMSDVVPIADDEIILDASGECKIGPSGMLLASQQPSSSRNLELNPNMPSTSEDGMQHYHHHEIEDGGVVEEMDQQIVGGAQSEEMAIQYDEDLSFQQHINTVLNRLNDEDKALMKFQMQKIILDARFGVGTARNLLKDEICEVEPHDEIDPTQMPNEEPI
ncbi:hypothetical protein GCK72_010578 [Caenorhabditis remanei]|uniref:MADF domain-containing protein n=1 Tax=Caenorhabditis remanei TaxID=31234 RepID=A0A6A5H642_CAERE|nr:hypothetical protein GCK72_010578 [Caenorhabditis remanei]KAF1762316.1 hypothetical protein GCK72_010578 [Caenorhabditis remanei]